MIYILFGNNQGDFGLSNLQTFELYGNEFDLFGGITDRGVYKLINLWKNIENIVFEGLPNIKRVPD
jgi:hypothetical protein